MPSCPLFYLDVQADLQSESNRNPDHEEIPFIANLPENLINCFFACIGIGAKVLPRIIIKRGAFVGARALVTPDVPEKAIVFGIPARVHGEVSEQELSRDIDSIMKWS